MDRYAIMSLFILVILSIWHAVIGALIFVNVPDSRITAKSWFVRLDQFVFYFSSSCYLVIHFILFFWLYSVPLKSRRLLKEKDQHYRQLIARRKSTTKKPSKNHFHYTPVTINN